MLWRCALAVREAPGKPTGRRLSQLAFDLGTSFWAATESLPLKGAARDHAGRAPGPAALHVNPQSEPSFVLTPPAGSALVFGGNVTHAGESVAGGERTVFVASFSTRGAR